MLNRKIAGYFATLLCGFLFGIYGCNNETAANKPPANDIPANEIPTSEIPINELPMYGNIERTQEQIDIDNKFIKAVTANQSREDASKEAVSLGWQYFDKGDLKTAMKRFNQAWLLDPQNPKAYWGFGVILGSQAEEESSVEKLDQSIDMLEKAYKLMPQNFKVIVDLAHSYTGKAWVIKYEQNKDASEYFKKANELYDKAKGIEPSYGLLYLNWAASLHYEDRNEEALNLINEAEALDIDIPEGLIKEIEDSIKSEK